MRYALSAVAGMSGLLLLGLAFYGQPAQYVQKAREQWDALLDYPAADQPADPDRDADAGRVARLQQQVTRLEEALRDKQGPAVQSGSTQPEVPQPAAPVSQQAVVVQSEVPRRAAPDPSAAGPGAAQAVAAPQLHAAPPGGTVATAESAAAVAMTDHRDAAKPIAPPVEPPKAEQFKAGPPKPAAQKLASVKPVPVPQPLALHLPPPSALPSPPPSALPSPPPSALPSPPVQDWDDVQSVLARLRHVASGSPPAQQVAAPPAIEPTPRPTPSPTLPGLNAARAALANGRIDDARRLLQEAQLQLVFGTAETASGGLASAVNGANDVGHALEALSANNVPLSRRYIDTAVNDLSGSGTNAPVRESQMHGTGWAPAYPPR